MATKHRPSFLSVKLNVYLFIYSFLIRQLHHTVSVRRVVVLLNAPDVDVLFGSIHLLVTGALHLIWGHGGVGT